MSARLQYVTDEERCALRNVRYRRIPNGPYEESAYEVARNGGDVVGRVYSIRSESWRRLSSGVRYSLRGRPLEWGYESGDGRRSGAIWLHRYQATLALLHEGRYSE